MINLFNHRISLILNELLDDLVFYQIQLIHYYDFSEHLYFIWMLNLHPIIINKIQMIIIHLVSIRIF